uniref:Uncharacterized protein n=1 Tax=Arundo donax TaxID=35708 RepID=A0A0A9E309_ARUDO
MLASHGFGALWYILSIQREDSCWRKACSNQDGCDPASLYCGSNVFGNNTFLQDACPSNGSDHPDPIFGIFLPDLQNVSQSTNFFEKLFYFFGGDCKMFKKLTSNSFLTNE